MEGNLREVIGNIINCSTVILNSPPPIFLSLYIFDDTGVKHFSINNLFSINIFH